MSQVWIVAGDYSSLPGQADYGPLLRAFRPASDPALGGEPVPLEELLTTASERALRSTGLDGHPDVSIRDVVTDLLVTTMPGTRPTALSLGLYATRLKRRLGLGLDCRSRFEVGSSDAGASVFASAVELLHSDPAPRTALVVAGQTMPSGRDAIRDIARVLDPEDRRYQLNMIHVGDALFDLHLRHGGLAEVTEALWPDGGAAAFLDALLSHKLDLATEYPAAYRFGRRPDTVASPRFAPWLRRCDIAPASNGACAVLLTSDPDLVQAWLRAGAAGRVVRVVGVGEGEAATSVLARTEPLGYHRAIRQALTILCRDAHVSLDFVRASGFAVLHDAFPSIELCFLAALGFTPRAALQRMLSWWCNPFGGLTTFSHSMGASGLVQIVKAFHVFTRPEDYVFAMHMGGRPVTRHPDLRDAGPVTCLTTSVGGPLSHVVTSLLESVEPDGDVLPAPFVVAPRHRFPEDMRGDFERQCRWLEDLVATHLEGVLAALGDDVALLEARTGIFLPSLPSPLPASLLADWLPPPVHFRGAILHLTPDESEVYVRMLGEAGLRDVTPWLTILAERAKASLEEEQVARFSALSVDQQARELKMAVVNQLRPQVGFVVRSVRGRPQRTPVLLTDTVVDAAPGALVRLSADVPLPVAVAEVDAPHLLPLWTPFVPAPFTGGPLLAGDDAARAVEVARQLHSAGCTRARLDTARELASVVAAAVRRGTGLPPVARRLVGELAHRSGPDPLVLARALVGCAGAPMPAERTPVAFCHLSLGPTPAAGAVAAEALSRIGWAMRRAEGWLTGADTRHSRVGHTFAVRLLGTRADDDRVTAISLTRFARDVYQDCIEYGVQVRAVVFVGEGHAFQAPGDRYDTTGPGEAAASSLLRWVGTLHESGGVALLRHGPVANGGPWIDGVWAGVGGEQLRAVDPPQALPTPRHSDIVYQVRRREKEPGLHAVADALSLGAADDVPHVHLIRLAADADRVAPLRGALERAGHHVTEGSTGVADATCGVLCWTRDASAQPRPLLHQLRLAEIRQDQLGTYLMVARLDPIDDPGPGVSGLFSAAVPTFDLSEDPDGLRSLVAAVS